MLPNSLPWYAPAGHPLDRLPLGRLQPAEEEEPADTHPPRRGGARRTRLVPRWPANGAHLLFDAMWSNASAETFARTAIPPAQLAKLRRVNISSLAPSWNTDCHGEPEP